MAAMKDESSGFAIQVPSLRVCTPKPQITSGIGSSTDEKKHQTAKKTVSMVRNPSTAAVKGKVCTTKLPMTAGKGRLTDVKKQQTAKKIASVVKPSEAGKSTIRNGRLTLTRPKEPEFETSHRVRSVKMKSSKELEEELMANIPKFKARPLNKKIMEAPTLQALPRSTPKLPVFQEFHLKTMERANLNAETSTVTSVDSSPKNQQKKRPHLTTPKTFTLETSLRARPAKVKSSAEVEVEVEEFEKIPKFKARPLNKKILESRGELGNFCNTKRQVTIPQEFHFAIDERIPPPATTVSDLFDKLSLHSESQNGKSLPRLTAPTPFHLHTEERGAEKEKKFANEVLQKLLEEEKARVPKAKWYPYSTDYAVVPPKPVPKQCTKPEPFQLESLVRHEEERRREREERLRIEKEEAEIRNFKAMPILKEDPNTVPEKIRKPLTGVMEFELHVEHRAVARAEFDKKMKEKEMMYKRYRDEAANEKLMEEEKAVKDLRRALVPRARPVPNFGQPFVPNINRRREMPYAAAASSSAVSRLMR